MKVLVFTLMVAQTLSQQTLDFGLGELLGALGGAAQQRQDGTCPTNCDGYPVPKRRIRPYSNGCSVPESMRSGLGDYTHFVPCCDLHDACYASCGVPKPFCESEFQKCMKLQCKYKKTQSERDDCDTMASLFVTGTFLFGCKGYAELQAECCECVLDREVAEKRVAEYASQFYSAYNQTHTLPEAFTKKFLDLPAYTSREKVIAKHGEFIFRLYRKYPQSIELFSRDGKSGRHQPTYFQPRAKKLSSSEL